MQCTMPIRSTNSSPGFVEYEINSRTVLLAMIDQEQRYRASAYGLLAALLRAAPDRALLDHLGELAPDGGAKQDELVEAMSGLAMAAQSYSEADLVDEYHQLFIGLGKGEIVPYASWYLTGFLMEQPLSDLRDDLRALGFERNGKTHEPEDHISALFEVICVMISDAASLDHQRRFFDAHLQPWLEKFFKDLGSAGSARFYIHVALFGAAFIELERTYLSMQS